MDYRDNTATTLHGNVRTVNIENEIDYLLDDISFTRRRVKTLAAEIRKYNDPRGSVDLEQADQALKQASKSIRKLKTNKPHLTQVFNN